MGAGVAGLAGESCMVARWKQIPTASTAQALAAQGYEVLQPNYRGSNLGYAFLAKGFGEYGYQFKQGLVGHAEFKPVPTSRVS